MSIHEEVLRATDPNNPVTWLKGTRVSMEVELFGGPRRGMKVQVPYHYPMVQYFPYQPSETNRSIFIEDDMYPTIESMYKIYEYRMRKLVFPAVYRYGRWSQTWGLQFHYAEGCLPTLEELDATMIAQKEIKKSILILMKGSRFLLDLHAISISKNRVFAEDRSCSYRPPPDRWADWLTEWRIIDEGGY